MYNFLIALFIILFLLSMGLIAFYTSKMRKREKNKPYDGFIFEVLLKGDINNDILPIPIKYKSNGDYSAEIESLYKNRNYWVFAFWFNLILFSVSFIVEKGI